MDLDLLGLDFLDFDFIDLDFFYFDRVDRTGKQSVRMTLTRLSVFHLLL